MDLKSCGETFLCKMSDLSVPHSNFLLQSRFGIQFFLIFQNIDWKIREQSEKWMIFHVFGTFFPTVSIPLTDQTKSHKIAEPFSYMLIQYPFCVHNLCCQKILAQPMKFYIHCIHYHLTMHTNQCHIIQAVISRANFSFLFGS